MPHASSEPPFNSAGNRPPPDLLRGTAETERARLAAAAFTAAAIAGDPAPDDDGGER